MWKEDDYKWGLGISAVEDKYLLVVFPTFLGIPLWVHISITQKSVKFKFLLAYMPVISFSRSESTINSFTLLESKNTPIENNSYHNLKRKSSGPYYIKFDNQFLYNGILDKFQELSKWELQIQYTNLLKMNARRKFRVHRKLHKNDIIASPKIVLILI